MPFCLKEEEWTHQSIGQRQAFPRLWRSGKWGACCCDFGTVRVPSLLGEQANGSSHRKVVCVGVSLLSEHSLRHGQDVEAWAVTFMVSYFRLFYATSVIFECCLINIPGLLGKQPSTRHFDNPHLQFHTLSKSANKLFPLDWGRWEWPP